MPEAFFAIYALLQKLILEHLLCDVILVVFLQLHPERIQVAVKGGIIVDSRLLPAGALFPIGVEFLCNLINSVREVGIIICRQLRFTEDPEPQLHELLFVIIQSGLRVCSELSKVLEGKSGRLFGDNTSCLVQPVKAELILVMLSVGAVKGEALVLVGQACIYEAGLQELRVVRVGVAAVGSGKIHIFFIPKINGEQFAANIGSFSI